MMIDPPIDKLIEKIGCLAQEKIQELDTALTVSLGFTESI